jgi:DNA-binding GntR family transcriptional regulator
MKRELAAQGVYKALREEIIAGTLEPGTRLRVRELAARFSTSDIPVREAIWMLQHDGLAENRPYAGACVKQYSEREINESLELRAHFEALAIRLSPPGLRPIQEARIQTLLAQLDDAASRSDFVAYGELNRRFHRELLDSCPNSRLLEIIDRLWDGQAGIQRVFHLDQSRTADSAREHRQIVDAFTQGDTNRASELIVEHRRKVAISASASLLAEQDASSAARTEAQSSS